MLNYTKLDGEERKKLEEELIPMTLRISELTKRQLEEIKEYLDIKNQGSETNLATLTRYAIDEYVKRFMAEYEEEEINIRIPLKYIELEELEKIRYNLAILMNIVVRCFSKVEEEKELRELKVIFEDMKKASNILNRKIEDLKTLEETGEE